MTRHALSAAVLIASLTPFAAHAQPTDHLSCYATKDSSPKAKYTVTLSNAAGTQTCTVRTPAKIACVAAAATTVTPTPPGGGPSGSSPGAFMCYPAKCAAPTATTNVVDQFGTRVIKFRAARFLCSPANLNAPAATPGTPTTTTLPVTGECRLQDGKCQGTCGGGQKCGAAVGTGSCECRQNSCGDADSPQCNGACDDPGKACIFNLSGCSCVNIP